MKPKNPYSIINTAGQKTAVVNNDFTRREQPFISKLMMTLNPAIEQVAFIEKPNGIYRSQMMGNELSVNGSLAGAYLISRLTQSSRFDLEISGVNSKVAANLSRNSISITFPKQIVLRVSSTSVFLQGIRYLLQPGFPETVLTTPNQRNLLKKFCGPAPAAGIIYYQDNRIMPLVYVKATNSFVWENACGSGSLAFFLLTRTVLVTQPSGQAITISTNSDTLTITSPIKEI